MFPLAEADMGMRKQSSNPTATVVANEGTEACLTGPAKEAVQSMAIDDSTDYEKVRSAILKNLNLTPVEFRRRFREIEFCPTYEPREIAQQIQAVGRR